MAALILVKLFTVTLYCCLVNGDEQIPLYISLISSIRPKSGFSAAGGIPAANMALDMINKRSDILAGYSLQYTDILDSKCDQTTALDAFFKHITEENMTYIATACCGCSTATLPVAEISHYWNIPQVSHSADLVLNDRSRFRNFFRMLPTNRNLGPGIVRVATQFGWKKMMIITQNEELFFGLRDHLQYLYTKKEWIIDISINFDSNAQLIQYEAIFKKIETEHFRIILINTYSPFAHYIFCEAFHRGLLAPKYVWMTYLWYNREWWGNPNSADVSCTNEDMQKAVTGSIGVIPDGFLLSESNSPTSSGLTPLEFVAEYWRRLNLFRINNMTLQPVIVPNIGFDLAWALALGLNKTAERVAQLNDSGCETLSGDIVRLEDFDYSNEKMGCILRESMHSVQFEGLSGPILFNANGSRPDNFLVVRQYKELRNGYVERATVARIDTMDPNLNSSFVFTSPSLSLWEGGVPYDGYPQSSIDSYNTILLSLYNSMAIIGVTFTVLCLIFNFTFRDKKILKLSSHNLNYLIILGSVVLYCCISIYVYMPSSVNSVSVATAVCNLRVWLFSFGYSVCFAVTLSKTWRVYYIFNNPSVKKKVIKDWMLLIIIILVVLGDLIILLIGTVIPTSRLKATEIRSKENPTTIEDVVKENYIYICLQLSKDSGQIIWLSISFAYKGLLQLIAIFMAFHTRKVKIRALNDSKETAAIIYINSIILIILCASVFVLEGYHNAHAAVFGLALFVQASMFLGVLFIPKMIALHRDPKEKKFMDEQLSQSTTNTRLTLRSMTENKEDRSVVPALQARIKELEDIITNFKTQDSATKIKEAE